MTNVLMVIWGILDGIFSFIENSFILIFNAIPVEAIPFLIGIFAYSIVAILDITINHMETGNKLLILKIFHKIFLVFIILFSVWRIGVVAMIDTGISIHSFAEFFINLLYILFGVILFIAFYKKIPWVKKALLILLWSLFLLLTFVICPAFSDFILSDSTLIQVLLTATIFVVPNSILIYQRAKLGTGEESED